MNKFPDQGTVMYDYGFKMDVMSELTPPNKFICGYCKKQAQVEDGIEHLPDCPQVKQEIDE